MNLIYFTKDAYTCLLREVDGNESKYYSDNIWLDDYFKNKGLFDYCQESTLDMPKVELICTDEDDQIQYDIANTKIFYEAYKNLTPLQASDPLLWTALCHIPYREYVLKRWKKKDETVTIDKRFFASKAKASLLYYNALSRLWWSGYLTYDEEMKSSNPWHLTEVLFSQQQIQKDIIDQPFSMNKAIMKGLLRALQRYSNENGRLKVDPVRKCCDAYLNHYGAVSILDTLSIEEIESLVYEYMKKN